MMQPEVQQMVKTILEFKKKFTFSLVFEGGFLAVAA